MDFHARPGLNASTVCVFSFEQNAYSKQIAEDHKDTHSTQLTPEELRGVLGQVDAARMREIFDLIARARLETGEKRVALVNCNTCVIIPIHYFTIVIPCKYPCTEGNDRVVCATACSEEEQALFCIIFVKKWSVLYIRLLKVLFPVNSVGSSFSTGTVSLSKTHVRSFHLSNVVCVSV
jgi:hypothetical protein